MTLLKRTLTVLSAAVSLSASSSLQAAPFHEGWLFWREGGEKKAVTLPHDAMIHQTRSADVPGGTASAFFPGGTFHYEKTFPVPAAWLKKSVTVRFGGVYRDAKVYINGKEAGGYPYGYTPFDVPADAYLHEGENTIRVDCSAGEDSRWYSGAGIYRPVELLVREKEHIETVHVTTVSLDPPTVKVEVRHGRGTVHIDLLDQGRVMASADGDAVEIPLPGARLWTAETPHLYSIRATLDSGDVYEDTFGIQQLSWGPDGFRVNGEVVLFQGGCIHSDNGILGMADYQEAADRRIRMLKAYGFNAIRSAHNPCSEAILRACDKYGMYVMDEAWDMWFQAKNPQDYSRHFPEYFLTDIGKMVEKDFNHPCVVMYSIGNEISEHLKPGGLETEKAIVDQFRRLDSSRATTVGLNAEIAQSAIPRKREADDRQRAGGGLASLLTGGGMDSQKWNEMMLAMGKSRNQNKLTPEMEKELDKVLDLVDIAGYNYGSGRYPVEGKLHPSRVLVGAETFPTTLWENWEMVKEYPYLTGDFLWTAWDYIGEVGLGAWDYSPEGGIIKGYPWIFSGVGMLDVTGEPTAEAFHAKITWDRADKTPYICVQPVTEVQPRSSMWRSSNAIRSWSWQGCEGIPAQVEVYSNASLVKLYLNGRQIGETAPEEGVARFTVPYAPGQLEAEAYEGGECCGRDTLSSARSPLHIAVQPEAASFEPGEILFVNVDLEDQSGIRETMADTRLAVTVEGAELLAFGSARPRTEEAFDQGAYTTFQGHAQAILRAGNQNEISIKVTADGLPMGLAVIKQK